MREKRTIKISTELPKDAVYYSNEYARRGNNHDEWARLYNSSFEAIEDVKIRFSSALDGLKRVVSAKNADETAYFAYTLTKLNDEFFLVEKNDDTQEMLVEMTKAYK